MKNWNLSHGKDGYSVYVTEFPTWAHLVEQAWYAFTVKVTRHYLCCRTPEWAWKVPMGRPQRSEYEGITNSLGDLIWDIEQRMCGLTFRREKYGHYVPITVEQAKAIDAEFVQEMTDIFGDEDERQAKR